MVFARAVLSPLTPRSHRQWICTPKAQLVSNWTLCLPCSIALQLQCVMCGVECIERVSKTVCVNGLTEMVAEGECWTLVAHISRWCYQGVTHVTQLPAAALSLKPHTPRPPALILPTTHLLSNRLPHCLIVSSRSHWNKYFKGKCYSGCGAIKK